MSGQIKNDSNHAVYFVEDNGELVKVFILDMLVDRDDGTIYFVLGHRIDSGIRLIDIKEFRKRVFVSGAQYDIIKPSLTDERQINIEFCKSLFAFAERKNINLSLIEGDCNELTIKFTCNDNAVKNLNAFREIFAELLNKNSSHTTKTNSIVKKPPTVRECAEVLAKLFETYPCNYGYCMKRILCDNCPDDKTPADCWEYLLKTRIEEQSK